MISLSPAGIQWGFFVAHADKFCLVLWKSNQKAIVMQVLATEVETEEEFLVNNLQKRLQKLTQEKVALESQLETENEYVTNQLQRKLEELRQQQLRLNHEKVFLENSLEAEQVPHQFNIINARLSLLCTVYGRMNGMS